jgi:hypothetical protein
MYTVFGGCPLFVNSVGRVSPFSDLCTTGIVFEIVAIIL